MQLNGSKNNKIIKSYPVWSFLISIRVIVLVLLIPLILLITLEKNSKINFMIEK
jgi:hypothetical protein